MKNRILKAVTGTVASVWVLAVCALDSESNIPLYVCVGCTIYLALVVYANRKEILR